MSGRPRSVFLACSLLALGAWSAAVVSCARDYSFLERDASAPHDAQPDVDADEPPFEGGRDADASNDTGLPDGSSVVMRRRLAVGSQYYGVGFTCALRGDVVHCWGANDALQLARLDGGASSTQPFPVLGPDASSALDGATHLAAGYRHACAIRGGEIFCWGGDDWGQLAINGGGSPVGRPVRGRSPSGPLASIVDLTAGGHATCALDADGGVYCAGENTHRQLTDSLAAQSAYAAPVPAAILRGARHIALGPGHGCAITSDAKVACWGLDDFRQAGVATATSCTRQALTYPCVLEPVVVSGLTDPIMLALGESHTCALERSGTVRCWGKNESGQLGQPPAAATGSCRPMGDADAGAEPCTETPLEALTGASQISVGGLVSCALQGGKVMCWGSNGFGQKGQGNNTGGGSSTPVAVKDDTDTTMTNVEEVAMGRNHGCAYKTNGEVWCWGSEPSGALGNSTANAFLARKVDF